VSAVLRDGDTYSSTIISEAMGQVWGPKIIVGMDEPEHHRHRALVSVAFRQRAVARWEESLVGRVMNDLIDQFIERGRADLVSEFTFAFPAKVISGVLGLPEEDYRQFQEWALKIITVSRDWDRAIQASNELREYLTEAVDARRRDPTDDLITDLVTAELDGAKLDDDEIYSFMKMLLPAGIETTYRSSGNLLYLLLTHPEQLDAIRADRSLFPRQSRRVCVTSRRCSSPPGCRPRTQCWQRLRSPPDRARHQCSGRPIGTLTPTTTQRTLTSSENRLDTCRSALDRTCVSVYIWLAWRRWSPSMPSSTGFRTCVSTRTKPSG
jgi:cytochrome P450